MLQNRLYVAGYPENKVFYADWKNVNLKNIMSNFGFY